MTDIQKIADMMGDDEDDEFGNMWILAELFRVDDGGFESNILFRGERDEVIAELAKYGTPIPIIHGRGAMQVGDDDDDIHYQAMPMNDF